MNKIPLYFIGWDYASPRSVPLKRLFSSPDSPYAAKAIVHDRVWVPSVDNIPLMLTEDFLDLAKSEPGTKAILAVKDSFHQLLWQRRSREFGFDFIDEGEIFLSAADTLGNNRIDLGVFSVPEAFDRASLAALQEYAGKWPNEQSNYNFRAYLNFLEYGSLTPLNDAYLLGRRDVWGDPDAEKRKTLTAGGLAWEIAEKKSDFLDQALLLGGRKQWKLLSSFPDNATGRASATLTKNFADSIKAEISIASFGEAEGDIQAHVEEQLGRLSRNDAIAARIDVEAPCGIAQLLGRQPAGVHAWIRLGRSPKQLLGLLRAFPIEAMSLACDRPGPLGLEVQLKTNPRPH